MGAGHVSNQELSLANRLLDFIAASPTAFHAISEISARLDHAGFRQLSESSTWHVLPRGRYYTTRGGSSIIAFRVAEDLSRPAFNVASSHSDSPTYRLKANPELAGPYDYLRLNVEGYGGMIDRTWLDRPLSVAGRVMVDEGDRLSAHLLTIDQDLLVIPSLAIHMDRSVNESGALNRQVDMMPLYSAGEQDKGSFARLVARSLGVDPKQIRAWDLYLYNRQRPMVWGEANEFVSAPRLDDLQCAFATLEGFLQADNCQTTAVYACFDNEEIGSRSRQGALSTFLPDTLRRILQALNMDEHAYLRAMAQSFLVSTDNAQALHPSHLELYDEGNRVLINRGVAIKESARQRYTTSSTGQALFESICQRAGVPTQHFSNRSDMVGGSTLGSLLMQHASMSSVDIGLPQLAMHSAFETAGTRDTAFLVQAIRAFYDTSPVFADDGSIRLS